MATQRSKTLTVIQKTTYYDGIVTNETAGNELVTQGFTGRAFSNTEEIYNFSNLAFKNDELISLENSVASNHIGGSTIAISNDACILYQTQGRQNEIGALKKFPSGSGSFNWYAEDFRGKLPTLRDLVVANLERELREEMSVPGDREYRCLTYLTGYGRLLNRNGKPEFFGLTLVTKAHDEFRIRPAELGFIHKFHTLKLDSLDRSIVLQKLSTLYRDMLADSNAGLGIVTVLRCAIAFLQSQSDEDFITKGFKELLHVL